MRGRTVSVSVGRLLAFLATLGQGVEVTAKPTGARGWVYVRRSAASLTACCATSIPDSVSEAFARQAMCISGGRD